MSAMLKCPLCLTPAVPACSEHAPDLPTGHRGPFWCEDDKATCPGCGAEFRVNIDDHHAYVVAVCRECGDEIGECDHEHDVTGSSVTSAAVTSPAAETKEGRR